MQHTHLSMDHTDMRLACGAETEAVDLLLEVEELGWLEQYVDKDNYRRTCLYLTSTSAYLPEPDDTTVLHTAFSIYMKVSTKPLHLLKWHALCAPLPGHSAYASQQGCG